MNPVLGNIIAVAAIVLLVLLCVRTLVRSHREGGCSGSCAGCSGCGGTACRNASGVSISKAEMKRMTKKYQAYLKEKERTEKNK